MACYEFVVKIAGRWLLQAYGFANLAEPLSWAPAGEGALLARSPLEFTKLTSYAAVLQNNLTFSLSLSALAIDILYFSLKRHKKMQKNRLRPRRAEKWSIFFCTARRKRFSACVNFLAAIKSL